MPTSLIALGANLGDREHALQGAIAALAQTASIERVVASRWHETAAVGGPAAQPPFLNAVVRVETSLSARQLFARLVQLEAEAGRTRDVRWGPRTLDCDLLLHGQAVLDEADLVVPHPRMAYRRFVLEPAAEVAGELRHPTVGLSIAQLLAHLNAARPYVAVAGLAAGRRWQVAAALARRLGARLLAAADFLSAEALLAGGDCSGSAGACRIEFLDRLAEPLAIERWGTEPAVSDFWLGQLLAAALASGQRQAVRAARSALAAIEHSVVRPKLLVLLAEGAERAADRAWRALEEVARGAGVPVAYVPADDPQTAADEAVAAVQAMG